MDYDFQIELAESVSDPSQQHSYDGQYWYNKQRITIFSKITSPQYSHTDISSIIGHEVLHHVLQKVMNEEVSRKLDNLCWETHMNFGLLLEKFQGDNKK